MSSCQVYWSCTTISLTTGVCTLTAIEHPCFVCVHSLSSSSPQTETSSFTSRSNESNRTNISYLLPSILAYVAGLLLTFLALYLEVGGQGGQPALCYLVPTVLGGTVIYAHCRGELKEMWSGINSDEIGTGSDSEGERLIGTGATNSSNVAANV